MSNQKKKSKAGLILIIAALAVVMAVAAYMLISNQSEYAEGDTSYDKISEEFISAGQPAGEEGTSAFYVDFDALREENPDANSWIINEGTVINYPIAQGEDNEYYLSHLFDGTKNKNGAIFMDYRNASDFSDRNTIIYGHHMQSGKMFASLVEYKNISYYYEHPQMQIITPEGTYAAQVFAAYAAPGKGSETYRLSFESDEEFAEYIELVKGMSEIFTGVEVQPTDRIVTLLTCTYEFTDARFFVHAKLVPVVTGEE